MNKSIKANLPEYICHKHVHAGKILSITATGLAGGSYVLGFDGSNQRVTHEWNTRHKPEVGGYYVIYGIGTPEQYTSYSPAKAFEEGYTRVDHLSGTEIVAREAKAAWSKVFQPSIHSLSDIVPLTPISPSELARTTAVPPIVPTVPKPSIGRIVVYHHPGSADGRFPARNSPAIVQEVLSLDSGYCRIFVFGPLGQHMDCVYPGEGPCQWSWPERS